MFNGLFPAIIKTQQQVFAGIAPSDKITPMGYLEMLLGNTVPNVVNSTVDDGSGHIRDVKIKYRPRASSGKSVTEDDCSIQANPIWKEQTLPSLMFRKNGTFLDYDTVRAMEKEASDTVMVGRPAPPQGILMEMYNILIYKANGILADVDMDLLTQQAAAFGKNVTTGVNTPKTVNFPLSTATNPLTQGLTSVASDVMLNEIRPGNFFIVGDGLINNVYLQMNYNTQNTNQQNYPNGILPKFYWEPYATSKWGANQFGIFEKNSVQLVNINKFNGFVSGDKLSTFLFTLTLPIATSQPLANGQGGNNVLQGFKFDAQLRHVDCPQDVVIDGATVRVNRGWILDLMCNYGQFNLPADAYDPTDRLSGNNGTLRYVATNA